MRLAGRMQLRKKREKEFGDYMWHTRDHATRVLVKFFRVHITSWGRLMRTMAVMRRAILERNSARAMCRAAKTKLARLNYARFKAGRKQRLIAENPWLQNSLEGQHKLAARLHPQLKDQDWHYFNGVRVLPHRDVPHGAPLTPQVQPTAVP